MCYKIEGAIIVNLEGISDEGNIRYRHYYHIDKKEYLDLIEFNANNNTDGSRKAVKDGYLEYIGNYTVEEITIEEVLKIIPVEYQHHFITFTDLHQLIKQILCTINS